MTSQQPSSFIRDFQQGREDGKLWREFVLLCLQFAHFVFSLASLIPDVFLHRRFGRRYLTLPRLLMLQAIPIAFGFDETVIALMGVHFTVAIVHALLSFREKKRWHSRCCGIPWLAELFRRIPARHLKTTPEQLAYWVEPVIPLGLAIVLGISPLGVLLAAAAAGMWLRWIVLGVQTWNRIYDVIDQEIEQERFLEALEGDSMKDTEGYIIPGAARLNDEQRAALAVGSRSVMSKAILDLLGKSNEEMPMDASVDGGRLGNTVDLAHEDRNGS